MTAVPLDPALNRVLRQARAARERRGSDGDAKVRLGALSADEARELDALLAATGARRHVLSGRPVTLPLTRIEAALQATGHDPAAVYAALAPEAPLRDRPAERRARLRRREEFWTWATAHPVVARRPRLRAWLDVARERGLIQPDEREALSAALQVLASLPLDQPCDRAVLAARLFGDAHALDDDERVGRLACTLLRADAGVGAETLDRAVWRSAHVLCDTTSSTVLTLGLTPTGADPLAVALRALHGRHVVLTLGALETSALTWPSTGTCYTCENPSVLREAERRLGPTCLPLVCTEGWPSDAARLLLGKLRAAGWRIQHHGDFDLGGTGILRHLVEAVGAVPWRFDAESYGRALVQTASDDLPLLPRSGLTATGSLEAALIRRRRIVSEELVLEDLLADLAQAAQPRTERTPPQRVCGACSPSVSLR